MLSLLLRKLRYRFENSLAKGKISIFLWLLATMLLVMLAYSLLVVFFERLENVKEPRGFLQNIYEGYYHLLAPSGATWEDVYYTKWLLGILCIIGMFVASILIGLVNSTIALKIEDLKRGRSPLLENNHIIIYGWTSKIFILLKELIDANENRKNAVVTILANGDKVEMENEIRRKIDSFKTTRIIVRSGSPVDVDDINLVVPEKSRSIIILPTDNEDSDMDVIKTLMALVNNPGREKTTYNIVTEINDPSKLKVAKLIGKEEVSIIQTTDIISRIMVQTCRQPGLSTVYNELLTFQGSELYIVNDSLIYEKTFRELLFGFKDVCVIGVKYKKGEISLNVDLSYVLSEGDRLIVMMEDDNALKNFSSIKDQDILESALHKGVKKAEVKEKTLLIGWNKKALTIIDELNKYVVPGSELMILNYNYDLVPYLEALKNDHKNLLIDSKIGDTSDIDFLESIGLANYDHIIVLSYENMDPHHADSRTLITLVQLRSLVEKLNCKVNIVSEMLDMRNKKLAELAKPDDFIVSDNITSLMLAQISENRDLEEVYKDLFDADGCEIYLKPITDYIKIEHEVNFYTLIEAASRRNEIVIGYKSFSGIITNPIKTDKIKFIETDRLIVISGN